LKGKSRVQGGLIFVPPGKPGHKEGRKWGRGSPWKILGKEGKGGGKGEDKVLLDQFWEKKKSTEGNDFEFCG